MSGYGIVGARRARVAAALAIGIGIGIGAMTVAATARAQGAGDQAAAEALFKQGRDLMTAGRLAEACPKLAESQRLDPGTGTLLNLATCYERNGQLASAWATYKEAATAAQNGDEQERAQLARRKASEIEPKLSMLTIVVSPAVDRPDLQIKRDGSVVGRPGWGVPIPVDAGVHAIDVTAPGRKAWRGQATVEGAGAQVSVEVPALEIDAQSELTPPLGPGGALTGPDGTKAAIADAPATAPSDGSVQRGIAVAMGGVGIGGVVVGFLFGAAAKSDNTNAKGHCLVDSACDAQGMALTTSAQHAATAATVGVIAGGAFVVAGVVLYIAAPSRTSPPASRLGLLPMMDGSSGGLALRGGW